MMKKLLCIFAATLLLFSCATDDDNTTENLLTGTWRLTATLLDPGDGSGTFLPIDSDADLDFSADGVTVTSNVSFCTMSEVFSATYSASAGTIIIDECGALSPFTIFFEIQENELILSYPCIEACLYKYVKP
ncbi:hypothetical protein KORDIASMS9_03330 [Kordia sp. SMS9]|uniref:lipocalin family protein n=1 Tax=Kordia sp. SMS9 TaxID=2282170 RepID=UPI000E10BB52|nr:lipocalin family protein [Kordia sp. SMS9]AXG71075.1 hypothetical protein KORDIASMS9_03330 [Kordia sp. SMS9]